MDHADNRISAACNGFLTVFKREKNRGLIVLLLVFILTSIKSLSKSVAVIKSRSPIGNYVQISDVKIPTFCRGLETSNKTTMTSTIFSRASARIVSRTGKIIIAIKAFNQRNVPKLTGGDMILVFANQSRGDGRVPGKVIDHGNGSYTGVIHIFWEGQTNLYVRLASAAENTCLRFNAVVKYGTIAYSLKHPLGIRATFLSDKRTELTPCNTNHFIFGSLKVCDFTTLNGGMPWFCGRPIHDQLSCRDLSHFSYGNLNRRTESHIDKIHDIELGLFKTQMTVNVRHKITRHMTVSCSERSPLESWREPSPTGYFWKSHWEPVNCQAMNHSMKSYRSCLTNKTLIMLGDSTVRQYANFFLNTFLSINRTLTKVSLYGPNFETYHANSTYSNRGITIIFRKHAMPFFSPIEKIPIKDIVSFPQILDSIRISDIAYGDMILLITYHTHFSMYSPESFRERVRHLVSSIKRFLRTKPSTKVFFKGPSACMGKRTFIDPKISHFYKKILDEEFYDLMDKVTYLNVWDIGVAHNVEDIHFYGGALRSEIDQFMSFLC